MSSVRASLRLRYPAQRQRTSSRSAELRRLPCRSSPWVGPQARRRRARWRTGSIGDILLTTPLVRALARRHPAAKLVYVTQRAAAALRPRAPTPARRAQPPRRPLGGPPAPARVR